MCRAAPTRYTEDLQLAAVDGRIRTPTYLYGVRRTQYGCSQVPVSIAGNRHASGSCSSRKRQQARRTLPTRRAQDEWSQVLAEEAQGGAVRRVGPCRHTCAELRTRPDKGSSHVLQCEL